MGDDQARVLAEALSETLNRLAMLALPSRFGPLPENEWPHLRQSVAQLRKSAENVGGWAAPDLHLKELRALLPALQGAIDLEDHSASSSEALATHALRFLSLFDMEKLVPPNGPTLPE